MGTGRTNVGGGSRIKSTVVLDDYLLPNDSQLRTSYTKNITVSESGYYYFEAIHAASSVGNTGSITMTFSELYTVPNPVGYTNTLTISSQGSNNSAQGWARAGIQTIIYLNAGTLAINLTATGNCRLYGRSKDQNGVKLTKLENFPFELDLSNFTGLA